MDILLCLRYVHQKASGIFKLKTLHIFIAHIIKIADINVYKSRNTEMFSTEKRSSHRGREFNHFGFYVRKYAANVDGFYLRARPAIPCVGDKLVIRHGDENANPTREILALVERNER